MQGFVEQIGEKQGNGRNGPYTLYSVKVGGDWLGAGFNQPSCKEGDFINYEIEQKGNYKNIKSISVAQAPANNAPSANNSAGAQRVDTRDISIRYQSSRKDAIHLTEVLLANDALAVPAKKGDKADAILAFVEDLTNQLYINLQDVMDNGGVSTEDIIPTPENG